MEIDVEKLRYTFVAAISWGPTRVSFGDAIAAFDAALAHVGYEGKAVQTSYSPVVDSLDVTLKARDSSDLEKQVLQQARAGRKPRKEDDGMQLDEHQDNAEAIENLSKAGKK